MTLNSALSLAYNQLTTFAGLDDFWGRFNTAFGTTYDRAMALTFKLQWLAGDFSQFPAIMVVSDNVLERQVASYDKDTNQIYLSDQFIAIASQQDLLTVLLEEYGNYVNEKTNSSTSLEESGQLFAELVQNQGNQLPPLMPLQVEVETGLMAVKQAFGTTGYIQFGSTKDDQARGVSTDANGNVYITGYTQGSLPGNSNLGGVDAYITKYDANGNKLWVKQLGTSSDDYGYKASTDSSGNTYFSGYTYGTLPGNSKLGGSDAYIAKYDTSGNQVWIKQLGSSLDDLSYGITTDTSGNAYITGNTQGSLLGNSNFGFQDAYVAKYNASGTQVWIKQFGTTDDDSTYAISSDSSANVYIAGDTFGSFSGNNYLGGTDVYIAKYDTNGNQVWVKQFGTTSSDNAKGISTDKNNNVYLAGLTFGSLPGNSNLGGYDAFVAKYNSSGTQVWVKQFGTSQDDYAYGVATDNGGNIYVAGYTYGSLPGNSSFGGTDAYLIKYDTNGNQIWIKQFGSSLSEGVSGVRVDNNGNIYVSGDTYGTLPGNTKLGGTDAFVVGFDANGNLLNTSTPLPTLTVTPNIQTVVEGFTNPQSISYTVSLSSSSSQTVTTQYSTSNGTALAGSEYTTTTGTLTFSPGVTSQTISIPILNDSSNEPDETFSLNFTNPTNAILGTSTVTTTLTDTLLASVDTTLPAGVENLTLTGTSAINGTGNAGNNVITGNTGNNVLAGTAGNDTLNGGNGVDTVNYSGIGQAITLLAQGGVTKAGGLGTDLLQHIETVIGETGRTNAIDASSVLAGSGVTVNADLSSNSLGVNGSGSPFPLSFSVLNFVNVTGTGNNDTIKGNSSNNILNGGDGNDIFNGGAGSDTLNGGNGTDTADYYDSTAKITLNLATGTASDGQGGTDTLSLIENVKGSNVADDKITGDGNNNILYGYGGNDTLNGGDGNDTLVGGAKNDTLIGGKGVDTAYYYNVTGAVTVNLATGTANDGEGGIDTLSQIENVVGSNTTGDNLTGDSFNNTLYGYGGVDTLNGSDGNDTLIGGIGNDTLIGGNGIDTAYYYNVTGSVTVNLATGTASNDGEGGSDFLSQIENVQGSNTAGDTLTGSSAVNVFYGYGGADILTGGLGNDSLYVGSDTVTDTVNYASGDGADTIYNFVRGVGGDILKFTSITAIDVQVSGTSTLFKVGDGLTGNSGFGTGTLLLTTSATSGFGAADVNVNLFGATFAFS